MSYENEDPELDGPLVFSVEDVVSALVKFSAGTHEGVDKESVLTSMKVLMLETRSINREGEVEYKTEVLDSLENYIVQRQVNTTDAQEDKALDWMRRLVESVDEGSAAWLAQHGFSSKAVYPLGTGKPPYTIKQWVYWDDMETVTWNTDGSGRWATPRDDMHFQIFHFLLAAGFKELYPTGFVDVDAGLRFLGRR